MADRESLFSFPHPVNEVATRLIAGGVVILAALAVALEQPWLVVAMAVGFMLRVTAGPRLSPLALFVTRVLIPILGNPYKPIAGPPKQFAGAIGLAFTTTAAVVWLGFGLPGVAYGVLGVLIGAAFLEAAFALCVGCKVFSLLMRTGIIPESVCRDCLDWEARAGRQAERPETREPGRRLARAMPAAVRV